MPKLIKAEHSYYVPTETWYCESEEELAEIHESAPVGSIAEILTNNGLKVKMKNTQGEWIDI